jgi:superfamily II DNA or RNA helicase
MSSKKIKFKNKIIIDKTSLINVDASIITKNEEELIKDRVKDAIKEEKTLSSLINEVCPADENMQNKFREMYYKLETEKIKINKRIYEITKGKLIRTLYDYQQQYINEGTNELLINSKCILESPTGSGKTLMCFNIIAKLYKELVKLHKRENTTIEPLNIVFVTPRLTLCSQSIDKDIEKNAKSEYITNINILELAGLNLNYLEYNSKTAKDTESKLHNNPNYNFISCTYQSFNNFVDFCENKNINNILLICDEFHYIYSWQRNSVKCNKLINNPIFKRKLFLSATPYKKQKENTELYGKLLNFVTVKQLIEDGHLCELEPLVEIDFDTSSNLTKEEREMSIYDKIPYMLRETFTKYKKNKGIVFCNTTKNCNKMYDILNKKLNKNIKPEDVEYIKIFRPYIGKNKQTVVNKLLQKPDYTTIEEQEELEEADELMANEETIDDEDIQNIESILKEYESYDKPCILISCKKIDIGYDHPPIDLIVIADNKQSFIDIAQSIGRGLRKYKPGKKCHVPLPVKITDICNNKFKTVISYLEYLKNNVGYNIETYIIKKNIKKTQIELLTNKANQLGLTITEEIPSSDYLIKLITDFYNENKRTQLIKKAENLGISITEENPSIDYLMKLIKDSGKDSGKDTKIIEPNPFDDIDKHLLLIRKSWMIIYDKLVISKTGSEKYIDPNILKFQILKDLVKDKGFTDKIQYKLWAREIGEEYKPEIIFKSFGWINYYDFLNIDSSNYPKTIYDWEKRCQELNINNTDDYNNLGIHCNNMPTMPEELYKSFGNIYTRLNKNNNDDNNFNN